MYGKAIRLSRLMHLESNKICIVPIDHGTTLGPIEGIKDYLTTVWKLISGGVDAIVVQKGILREISRYPELTSKGRFIMHLSVSTSLSPDPNHKVLVSSVKEAMILGADGVSVHINLGTSSEKEMIKDLGIVSRECMAWGMPLMAMMYCKKSGKNADEIAHAARLAEELGADIVKVDYPGSIEDFKKIIAGVRIPVVIAGGEYLNNQEELLNIIDSVILAGASGVAIGRNVFQHCMPEVITNVITRLVHGEVNLHNSLSMIEISSNMAQDFSTLVKSS
ncbi:MAG: deoxyribose-phosphate aldolase [Firmicutes bacterium HGW-Firmicutes-7]|nr:MAG: deoxyribose-phosphate aldolase [Firmicutes bacterium HGW-Firmicutes-7]